MCEVVIFWYLQNYFQEKGCFCAECARYTFWKMIFAKTRFALPASKSRSHIILLLKTIKIKVQLNHKIKPSNSKVCLTWIFKSNCVIGKLTGTCFSLVSLNDPSEQK